MIIRPTNTNTLPYGYGIKKPDPVHKTQMDMQKEREQQNQEKRKNLLAQKSFLQMLEQKIIDQRIAEEARQSQEAQEETRHIDIRI